jgi:hypothetical protein
MLVASVIAFVVSPSGENVAIRFRDVVVRAQSWAGRRVTTVMRLQSTLTSRSDQFGPGRSRSLDRATGSALSRTLPRPGEDNGKQTR